jgi:vacuolar-type H+-ATPase subunit D/Vma8
MIAPNKQNLIQLGNQKKVTQSGYRLLKEKRAGLISYFLNLSKSGKEVELELISNTSQSISKVAKLFSIYDIYQLNKYLFGEPSTYLYVSKKRISGVYIDSIHIEISAPIKKRLKNPIQKNLKAFSHTFPLLIKLAQHKLNCNHIAEEILKTNRQIANLEKRIESITASIKYINSVLSDKENLEKGILIKLFV